MGIMMSEFFKRNDKLDRLVRSKELDGLFDVADSSVTIAYCGDGVMLPEIFDNGACLARAAGDQEIWQAWDSDREQIFFFIGPLETVIEKVKRLKDGDDADVICARCSSEITEGGECLDETCPFYRHQQHCEKGWEGHPEKPGDKKCTCES